MSPQTTMCMHVTFAPRIQSTSLNRNVSTPQWCSFVYQLYTVHRPTSDIGIDVMGVPRGGHGSPPLVYIHAHPHWLNWPKAGNVYAAVKWPPPPPPPHPPLPYPGSPPPSRKAGDAHGCRYQSFYTLPNAPTDTQKSTRNNQGSTMTTAYSIMSLSSS